MLPNYPDMASEGPDVWYKAKERNEATNTQSGTAVAWCKKP